MMMVGHQIDETTRSHKKYGCLYELTRQFAAPLFELTKNSFGDLTSALYAFLTKVGKNADRRKSYQSVQYFQ